MLRSTLTAFLLLAASAALSAGETRALAGMVGRFTATGARRRTGSRIT